MKLGTQAQDRITGFAGVVIGHVNYISGCNQVLLAPKVAPDGALRASEWFDEQRLEPIEGEAIVLDNGETPGFDRAAPTK